MTIDEHIEQAKECAKGITIHADSMGWRVTQLVLAEEVERLRVKLEAAEVKAKHWSDDVVALTKNCWRAEAQATKLAEALERIVSFTPKWDGQTMQDIACEALAAYRVGR